MEDKNKMLEKKIIENKRKVENKPNIVVEKIDDIEDKIVATLKKFRYDFKEFSFGNNFIGAATGIAIGSKTKETIENILNKVVLPLIHKLGHLIFSKKIYNLFSPYHTIIQFSSELIWDIVQWLIVIVLTFVLIEYFFSRYFLGFKTTLTKEENDAFIKAQKEAQKSKIIVGNKDIKEIEKKNQIAFAMSDDYSLLSEEQKVFG